MRILLVVMFGLILAACGQDYEEVYGVKIGAPISKVEGIEEYGFIESCDLALWSKEPIDELGIRTILAVDGVVVGVVINENESEFEDRVLLFREKHGEPIARDKESDEWITFITKDGRYSIEAAPSATTYSKKNFLQSYEEVALGCF